MWEPLTTGDSPGFKENDMGLGKKPIVPSNSVPSPVKDCEHVIQFVSITDISVTSMTWLPCFFPAQSTPSPSADLLGLRSAPSVGSAPPSASSLLVDVFSEAGPTAPSGVMEDNFLRYAAITQDFLVLYEQLQWGFKCTWFLKMLSVCLCLFQGYKGL